MKTNLSSQISLHRVSPRYYRPENAFEKSVLTRLEKIPTDIYESVEEGANYIAREIAKVNGSFVNKPGLNPFYDAPTLIIVFANKNISTYIEDGSAVISNIINGAFSLGVDSCWVHRAYETFQTEFGKSLMKKWGLSDEYVGIGNVVLGYRDMILPPPSPRKEDFIIFD